MLFRIHSTTRQGDERLSTRAWPMSEAVGLAAEMLRANPGMKFRLVPDQVVSPDTPTPFGMVQGELDFTTERGASHVAVQIEEGGRGEEAEER